MAGILNFGVCLSWIITASRGFVIRGKPVESPISWTLSLLIFFIIYNVLVYFLLRTSSKLWVRVFRDYFVLTGRQCYYPHKFKLEQVVSLDLIHNKSFWTKNTVNRWRDTLINFGTSGRGLKIGFRKGGKLLLCLDDPENLERAIRQALEARGQKLEQPHLENTV